MKTNPLFSDNRLKLGVFGHNVSNGCAITTVDERYQPTWENTLAISQAADADGFEAVVPVARWRGFGGPSDFNGTNFETYTWAAGLAQATDQICVMTTSHVPTVHPLFAAKQGATVDHISGGRFALNVVCGWFKPEFDMFGSSMMNHDERYAYSAEWLDIVKMLWSRGDEFDFEGKYFNMKKGFSMPKPIQQPPPIMNAGGSSAGQRFAAKYADMAFILVQKGNLEATRHQIKKYRDLAFNEFGREIQIWCNAYVVHGSTQKEADDYLNHYVVENGDDEAVDNLVQIMTDNAKTIAPEKMAGMKFHFKAGWGGYPLVGTPDKIVTELESLSSLGVDGVLLSWVDYRRGLDVWRRTVAPLLDQSGLRRSARAPAIH